MQYVYPQKKCVSSQEMCILTGNGYSLPSFNIFEQNIVR